jgi:hypothetical protein
MIIGHPTQDPLNPLRDAPDYQTFLQTLLKNPGAFAAYYFDFEMEPYQMVMMKLGAGIPVTEQEARDAGALDEGDFRYDPRNRNSLILLPAGHGKSTLIAKVLPIFELCRNPNIRQILVMKSDSDVKKYSISIRKILQSNEKLIRDFGPFRPSDPDEVWNSEAINVAKRTILDEHNTIEFFGAGGTILGHRCDLLIMDDVVTEKNSLTPEMRDKYHKWFDETVATAPRYMWPWDQKTGRVKVPKGIYWPEEIRYERLVVSGTTFHPEDLYAKMKNDRNYNYVRFDCYLDPGETIPLSPKLMPLTRLKEEEESAGLLSFNRRYRNAPFDESEMAFQKAWIYGGEWKGIDWPGCLDESRSFGDYEKDWYITGGFDPATGRGSRQSTWPSYIVLGTDDSFEDGDGFKYYIIDIFRQQMGLEDQISVLLDGDDRKNIPGFHKLYDYDIMLAETNSFCTWIMDHHRVVDATLNRIPIKGYENQKRKEDPEMNVRKMEPEFMNGRISIPYKTPEDKLKAKELIKQLLLFPKGVHDYCMALYFAYHAADRRKSQYRSFYRPGFSGRTVKNPHYA